MIRICRLADGNTGKVGTVGPSTKNAGVKDAARQVASSTLMAPASPVAQ